MNQNRLISLCLAGLAIALATVPAVADGYSETLVHDPTPGTPGDECTITFQSSTDTPQSRTDVGNAKSATENALAKSATENALAKSDDMTTKVRDACANNGNALTVNVNRNNKDTTIADTNSKGTINIDPGDIEAISGSMSGKPADIAKLAGSMLTEVIAHQTDHNRTTAADDHGHPAKDSGTTGKPVDDENAVLGDLGTGVKRNNYAYEGDDGKWHVDWTVDAHKVTLDADSLLDKLNTVAKAAESPGYNR